MDEKANQKSNTKTIETIETIETMRGKMIFAENILLIVALLVCGSGACANFPENGMWIGSGDTLYSDGQNISFMEILQIKNNQVRGKQVNQDRETEYIKWDLKFNADGSFVTTDGATGYCRADVCEWNVNSDTWVMTSRWIFNENELRREESGSFGQLSYRMSSVLKRQNNSIIRQLSAR